MDATYRHVPVQQRGGFAVPQRKASTMPVTLAAVLVYLLLIPQQFNIALGGIYLSAFRVFLLGGSLYLLTTALHKNMRFAWPDLMIIMAVAWIWLASYMSSGSVLTALEMGGSHTVDMGLAYFFARATIRTPTDLRRLLVLITPGIFIIGSVIAVESVSRTHILQPIASALTGQPMPISYEIRMGLLRGTASFPHPILAGIVMASFLPIYLMSGLRGWPKVLGVIAASFGVFSMSSAAMLGVVVGGILVAYDWLSERIANVTWRLFMIVVSMLYITVELTSNSGFYGLLIRYASLNTGSAYNRILIWNYGTENVARHPWFGIGYADWDRPDWMHWSSFDHFWLISALRFGIPAAFFLLAATLIALTMVAKRSWELPFHDSRMLRGIAISLAVFSLGLNSVTLWMAAQIWFFMLIGLSVTLGSEPVRRLKIFRPSTRLEYAQKPVVQT